MAWQAWAWLRQSKERRGLSLTRDATRRLSTAPQIPAQHRQGKARRTPAQHGKGSVWLGDGSVA